MLTAWWMPTSSKKILPIIVKNPKKKQQERVVRWFKWRMTGLNARLHSRRRRRRRKKRKKWNFLAASYVLFLDFFPFFSPLHITSTGKVKLSATLSRPWLSLKKEENGEVEIMSNACESRWKTWNDKILSIKIDQQFWMIHFLFSFRLILNLLRKLIFLSLQENIGL